MAPDDKLPRSGNLHSKTSPVIQLEQVARPKTSSPVLELRELLLWARSEGIVLGTVCVGDVSVTVTDLRMEGPKAKKPRRGDILREFAGEHAAMLREAGLDDDSDEDDDKTAVQ